MSDRVIRPVTAPPPISPVRLVLTFTLHLVLWLPLIALRIWAIHLERVFREFEMRLPLGTELLLSGGFIVLFAIMSLAIMADMVMLVLLARSRMRHAWSLLMILIPLGVSAAAGLALALPMLRMVENLSR